MRNLNDRIPMPRASKKALCWNTSCAMAIESFNQTFKLTGNHFIAYVRNSQYIKTRIAAPVGTFMIPDRIRSTTTTLWSGCCWSAD
jgi:hypothetical protein